MFFTVVTQKEKYVSLRDGNFRSWMIQCAVSIILDLLLPKEIHVWFMKANTGAVGQEVRLCYVTARLVFASGSSSFPADLGGGGGCVIGLINNSQVSMILCCGGRLRWWSLRKNYTLYLLVVSYIGIVRPMRNLRVFVAETRLWILAHSVQFCMKFLHSLII